MMEAINIPLVGAWRRTLAYPPEGTESHAPQAPPLHLIIVGQGTNRYAVEITADLDNKLRELSLRKEALLYIDTFPTVRARLNAVHAGVSKERMQQLIEEKNPRYENWAGRDIETLCRI